MPRITPARIDSHGNPGIGGNVRGVETELDVNEVTDVGVAVVVAIEV
jgi:hypothetical protein